jgi:hypothetical protein
MLGARRASGLGLVSVERGPADRGKVLGLEIPGLRDQKLIRVKEREAMKSAGTSRLFKPCPYLIARNHALDSPKLRT